MIGAQTIISLVIWPKRTSLKNTIKRPTKKDYRKSDKIFPKNKTNPILNCLWKHIIYIYIYIYIYSHPTIRYQDHTKKKKQLNTSLNYLNNLKIDGSNLKRNWKKSIEIGNHQKKTCGSFLIYLFFVLLHIVTQTHLANNLKSTLVLTLHFSLYNTAKVPSAFRRWSFRADVQEE